MSKEYREVFENFQNVVPGTINYFLENNTNSYQGFQQIPTSTEYNTIVNSPIYEKNIKENTFFSKPVSYYTYLANNNDNSSTRGKEQNNIKFYYAYSPKRKNNEISKTNILSNFNYDIYKKNIISNQTPTNLNSSYENINNYVTYVAQNDNSNKYRSRSPTITRNNNYLINGTDPNIISTFYSRNPGSSINNRKNNYNNISSYTIDTTPNDNIIINNLTSDYHNFNYNNEYEILYPSSSNNEVITKIYNVPSTNQNNTYYSMTPNTKSTDHLLNNTGFQTYQTINLQGNTNNTNNKQYSYVPNITNVSDFKTLINDNEKNNIINTPSKDNRSPTHYISYPMNSINTIPSTKNYIQIQTHSPNSANINSIPSSSEMLIPNNSYRNQISVDPYQKDYNSGNNKIIINDNNQRNNQYSNRIGNPCFKNNNNYSIERQVNSPAISKFNKKNIKYKNNNIEGKLQNYSPSFYKEKKSKGNLLNKAKNYANNMGSSHASKERSKEDIKNSIFSKVKRYVNEKLEIDSNDDENSEQGAEIEEEISTNRNNSINKANKISNKGKYNKESSFFNKNDYNIKSNLIKNESAEEEPEDSFSQYMFSQINKIRTNPKNYIPKIKSAMNNICTEKKGRIIYKGRLKVALCKGKEAFEEAISDLNKMEPMEPLVFKKELCVEISEKEKEFKSGDYLRNKIKEKIKNGIPVNAFWRDIINDPEINVLLMIVDDNAIRRGYKRKDILRPEMKYIGINSGNLDERFVCYTVLSED